MADTGLFNTVYNPDVLTCLANLSNDEVFTPPDIANAMLDMLPQELFRNPDTKFLDPACKSGVFLREIAKRLIVGLEPQFPDLQERIDHIMHHQLYGIAITELTAMLSRRSLYCTKYPENDEFSVSVFDKNHAGGNILYRRTKHVWRDGRCVFCGISNKTVLGETGRGDTLEAHAYEWIHVLKPEEIFNMKFDVIISNPPYQLSDGGNAASALPIYQKFVQQSQKLSPRYLTMIIPARWFMGGRGLDSFRNDMLHDDRIRVIHDFPSAGDCFPGVEIKGGVCYFLWERDSHGLCKVYSHDSNIVDMTERPLLEKDMDTFIRSDVQISVLKKVQMFNESSFSEWLNAGRYYGFHTKVEWDNEKKQDGNIQTADGKSFVRISAKATETHSVKVYIHGGVCYVSPSSIPKNCESVGKYKVIIPRSGNPGGSIVGKPKLSEPNTCSSNTYVVAIPPHEDLSETQARNVMAYITTKFLRFLVSIRTSTQDMPPKAYEFVPLQDFSVEWNDEKLYRKYNLSQHEIQVIEETIPEMNLGGDDNG